VADRERADQVQRNLGREFRERCAAIQTLLTELQGRPVQSPTDLRGYLRAYHPEIDPKKFDTLG
jgi:hypothetical protein